MSSNQNPTRLPEGARVICGEGEIYTYWEPRLGIDMPTVHLGFMSAGTPWDGKFRREVIESFLQEAGLRSLEELVHKMHLPGYGHIATNGGGMFSSETLYVVSLRRDSRIYEAELNLDELCPTLRG